jgi:SAM-dependent methyltransferase
VTAPGLSPAHYFSRDCEELLRRHGDGHRAVGYTSTAEEARAHYALMVEIVRERDEPIHLLDFGCGLAHMLDYLETRPDLANVRYSGLDLSEEFLEAARKRHPKADLFRLDALADEEALPQYDYITLNLLFNFRGKLTYDEMKSYWQSLTSLVFRHARKGIAFNTMSKHVDWERDDLFHLPFDEMAAFVAQNLSRHFVIRHDYPAFEYTTYVYHEPWAQ